MDTPERSEEYERRARPFLPEAGKGKALSSEGKKGHAQIVDDLLRWV